MCGLDRLLRGILHRLPVFPRGSACLRLLLGVLLFALMVVVCVVSRSGCFLGLLPRRVRGRKSLVRLPAAAVLSVLPMALRRLLAPVSAALAAFVPSLRLVVESGCRWTLWSSVSPPSSVRCREYECWYLYGACA